MLKKINKRGVSMMISYVILISIAISLSIGVFVWLKAYANVEPLPECDPETLLILKDYGCGGDSITLDIKNNGFFNVSGYTLLVGNTTQRIPIDSLSSDDGNSDYELGPSDFVFTNPLSPGKNASATFMMSGGYDKDVKILQIQAFILSKEGEKVPCENAVIMQEVDCEYVAP